MIRFRCEHCREWLTIAETRAGETGQCPLCRQTTHVPQVSETPPAEAELASRSHPVSKPPAPGDRPLTLVREAPEPDPHAREKVAFYCQLQGPPQMASGPAIRHGQEAIPPSRARLIDVLLYPMNLDGLARMAIFALGLWVLHWLILLLRPWIDFHMISRGTLLLGFFWIFVASYAAQYFSYCILDSAKGGTRAPALAPLYTPGKGNGFSGLLIFAGALALCFGPAALYRLLAAAADWRFWGLVFLGVFYLPMTLLSGMLFDSIEGLNPVSIVRSIAATLPAYVGLVLRLILLLSPAAATYWISWRQGVPLIFSYAAYLYSLWIAGHLLGRFYLRQKDKLGWDL
jgi:hypothetical protein